MDNLMLRRRAIFQIPIARPNTSPRIAEYGVYWNRTQGGKTENTNWCVTEWYYPSPSRNALTINGYIGSDSSYITFQFENEDGSLKNWYYFAGINPRRVTIQRTSIYKITFSIQVSEIENSYIYIEETGQILFAGKNTIYYGYTNINDMP